MSCPAFSAAAESGCCESIYELEACYICGDGRNVTTPAGIITSPEGDTESCAIIDYYGQEGYFDDAECQYFTDLASDPCCQSPPSAGGNFPSLTPQQPTAGGTTAPAAAPAGAANGNRNSAALPASLRMMASAMTLATAMYLWLSPFS